MALKDSAEALSGQLRSEIVDDSGVVVLRDVSKPLYPEIRYFQRPTLRLYLARFGLATPAEVFTVEYVNKL